MSCPEFSFAPRGRQGIGVIQPQSGLDYPLVAPSEDIRYLLADMYFEYDDLGLYDTADSPAVLPLRIKWLYGVGCEENAPVDGAPEPTHAADIVIVDANDAVVFDSTDLGDDETFQRFTVKDWGADYKLYEWMSNSAVCRLIVYTNWSPDENAPRNYDKHLAPESAVIDERAVYRMPKRVRRINVLTTETTRKRVIFQAGYNMRLVNEDPEIVGLRNRTAVTFDCAPGYGFGQYSDCTEEKPKYIYTINGTGPNEYGNFSISGGECIFARIPTVDAGDGKVNPVLINGARGLRVGSDCPACCDCIDYVNTATYMNFVRDEYSRIGQRSHSVKLLHEENIDRWVSQRNCRVSKPLRISLAPLSCPYMEVILQFCNQCPECVENVVLNVNMTSTPGGASAVVVPGYTLINGAGLPNEPFNLTGTWPNFSAPLGFVDKGASVFVRFLLKFTPKTFPYSIKGTLTGTIGPDPITPCDPNTPNSSVPSASEDTRALYCNAVGCTDIFNDTFAVINVDAATALNRVDGSRRYFVSASATNEAPVNYQWQRSLTGEEWLNLINADLAVSGAQTNTLVLETVYLLQYPDQQYRVVLTAADATTRNFTPPAPTQELGTITIENSSTSNLLDGSRTYSVSATTNNNETITYQWEYTDDNATWVSLTDDADIAGAATASLTISATYLTQNPNRKYRVRLGGASITEKIYAVGTISAIGRTAWARGTNTSGELGQSNTTFQANPVTVGAPNSWAALSAGGQHTLAINTSGEIYSWGKNSRGQIGNGNTNNFVTTPTRVGTQSNWIFVSAGNQHSLAINANGELWGWGANFWGQLGDTTLIDRLSPIRIGNSANWVYAYAGTGASFAINTAGEIWSWGDNTKGLLGLGDTTRRLTPTKINSAITWVKVEAQSSAAIALSAAGDAYVWGSNQYGVLGLNLPVANFKTTPTLLSHVVNSVALTWQDVSISEHGLGVTTGGALYAWGKNNFNQIGLNDPVPTTTGYYLTPQLVNNVQNWKSVYASNEYSLAMTAGNIVYGFGSNAYSVIATGGGNAGRYPTPATIAVNQFNTISAGGTFTAGLLN